MRSPALVFLALGAVLTAQVPAPLTLAEALQDATVPATASAQAPRLAESAQALERAAASPALALTATAGSVPQPHPPDQESLAGGVVLGIGPSAGRRGALQRSQGMAQAALAGVEGARRTSLAAVVSAFYAVAADEALREASHDALRLAQRSLDAARQRHRLGVSPLVDVERAEAARALAQADVAAARAALDADRGALSYLIGGRIVQRVSLPVLGAAPSEAQTTARAVSASPEVAIAAANLRAAEGALLEAEGGLEPGLSLAAGTQWIRQGTAQSVGPWTGLTVTVPVETGLLRAALVAERSRVAAARLALREARSRAVAHALADRSQALRLAAGLSDLRLAVAAARKVADADLAGYRLGAVNGSDLITSQRQLALARAGLAAAAVGASRAQAAFDLEIGVLVP